MNIIIVFLLAVIAFGWPAVASGLMTTAGGLLGIIVICVCIVWMKAKGFDLLLRIWCWPFIFAATTIEKVIYYAKRIKSKGR